MKKYLLNESIDNLEYWPFEGDDSNYKIVRGNPRASSRIDVDPADGRGRLGI